jgi:hypothetical protein
VKLLLAVYLSAAGIFQYVFAAVIKNKIDEKAVSADNKYKSIIFMMILLNNSMFFQEIVNAC